LPIVFGGIDKVRSDLGHTNCIKAMFIAPEDVIGGLKEELLARYGRGGPDGLGGGIVSLARSTPVFLELTHASATKGTGMVKAAAACGISAQNIMAFGDEENDLSMFESAGVSIVPANASVTAQAKASHVCAPNTEDGPAIFLEDYFSL
jgi:hydroxymethylpyrimidine pyrophosphatase-like HAD family hydrolase